MDRRSFMTLSGTAGVAALSVKNAAAAENQHARDYLELRQYQIDTEAQKEGFKAFMQDAAIPALNRTGISPVGVFEPAEDLGPIYVLLRHKSLESFATLTEKLKDDQTFIAAGADFLDAAAEKPAYARMESALMVAFTGMPKLESPAGGTDRVYQLRIYESPSVQTGQKKIEMFNRGEIDIFRQNGLNPVFFGETLSGGKMPNLTYMLSFDSMEQQKASWKRFVSSPEWKALSSMPEYADKKILCGITNLSLKPMACSQLS
jgi:NIPSNAP protein